MKTAASVGYKVSDNLYLVKQPFDSAPAVKPAEVATNHIVVIDVSGSMSYDLPKIRDALIRKLPKLIGNNDTLSMIWFSGRSQFGTLFEAEPVSTLADLQQINKAIERWLRPVCLTGFKEPLQEVARLVSRIGKKRPGTAFSLFFMSDGHDNQFPRLEILKAAEEAAVGLSASTIVEYGFYADRHMLSALAEKTGGTLIFSDGFDKYEPQFESAMQKRPSGTKRVEVQVKGDPIGGFVFALDGKDIVTYAVEGDRATLPEGAGSVYYLSSNPGDVKDSHTVSECAHLKISNAVSDCMHEVLSHTYAAVSLFAVRMRPDIVYPILKALGDVTFIEFFGSCFGKQRYTEFMEAARDATFDGSKRWTKGYDPNKVPCDDAFTVLDLLRILSEDDGNHVLMEHPEFKYTAIGRGRVDVSDRLTNEEQEEIQKLTGQIAAEKDANKITELTAKIAAITTSKQPALKFETDPAPDGYSISNLTFNESRPNVSILVKKSGFVDISSRLPAELKGKIPDKFPTFIYRNYAVIKDGFVNIKKLPVRLTSDTEKKLRNSNMPSNCISTLDGGNYLIDVGMLPVINRNMVKSVSAREFFATEYELFKAQTAQKVFNSFVKELLPSKKPEGFAVLYGEFAAEWLKKQGLNDWTGFSPKTVQDVVSDSYVGKELKVTLRGYSTLPSLKDLRAQIQKNKLNASGKLMKVHYDRVESFLNSDIYMKAADKDAVLKAWLDGEARAARNEARSLIYKVAQTTFCIIVGQVWIFPTIEEDTGVFDFDGNSIACKAELRNIDIVI